MIKLVAMFTLLPDTDREVFDDYFRNKHAWQDASKMPGLRRYTIGRVIGAPAGEPVWRWVNELWFDDVESAQAALNSAVGVAAGDDLMPRVAHFTAVFVEDEEVGLP